MLAFISELCKRNSPMYTEDYDHRQTMMRRTELKSIFEVVQKTAFLDIARTDDLCCVKSQDKAPMGL